MELIAAKTMRYGTRRLQPGDVFTPKKRHGRLLVLTKKAYPAPEQRPDPFDHDGDGRPGGSPKPAGELSALRQEYTEKLGKRPFNGWDADTLREKIAAA